VRHLISPQMSQNHEENKRNVREISAYIKNSCQTIRFFLSDFLY
jgi:hypothetical protein